MNYNFIKDVSQILEMYSQRRALSGEDFNLFSIMSMEADEVFTHSALLAELLHPKGSHGLGSKPLALFIEQFLDPDFPMSLDQAVCRKEDHIGFTNADSTEGGRVDIVIKDLDGHVIIIENKIYAAEQLNQLQRYRNNYPTAELFYLTLDGKESDQLPVSDDGSKIYRNLSYRDDVTSWIAKCAQLAYDKPMLREVLNQYLHLLKKLTNNSTNTEMSEKITEIITENFEACLEIYKNFERVSAQLKNQLLEDICSDLKAKFPELTFAMGMQREVEAIKISGFEQGITMNFRFKNQKWPVISIRPESSSYDGGRLQAFKADIIDAKIASWWKILPVLSDDRLLPNQLRTTQETFISEISKTIEMIKPVDKTAVLN